MIAYPFVGVATAVESDQWHAHDR